MTSELSRTIILRASLPEDRKFAESILRAVKCTDIRTDDPDVVIGVFATLTQTSKAASFIAAWERRIFDVCAMGSDAHKKALEDGPKNGDIGHQDATKSEPDKQGDFR